MSHNWKALGSAIARMCWKKRKRNTKNDNSRNIYANAFCRKNKNINDDIASVEVILFEIQGIGWDNDDENKLQVDEKNNKNWKVWKKCAIV